MIDNVVVAAYDWSQLDLLFFARDLYRLQSTSTSTRVYVVGL